MSEAQPGSHSTTAALRAANTYSKESIQLYTGFKYFDPEAVDDDNDGWAGIRLPKLDPETGKPELDSQGNVIQDTSVNAVIRYVSEKRLSQFMTVSPHLAPAIPTFTTFSATNSAKPGSNGCTFNINKDSDIISDIYLITECPMLADAATHKAVSCPSQTVYILPKDQAESVSITASVSGTHDASLTGAFVPNAVGCTNAEDDFVAGEIIHIYGSNGGHLHAITTAAESSLLVSVQVVSYSELIGTWTGRRIRTTDQAGSPDATEEVVAFTPTKLRGTLSWSVATAGAALTATVGTIAVKDASGNTELLAYTTSDGSTELSGTSTSTLVTASTESPSTDSAYYVNLLGYAAIGAFKLELGGATIINDLPGDACAAFELAVSSEEERPYGDVFNAGSKALLQKYAHPTPYAQQASTVNKFLKYARLPLGKNPREKIRVGPLKDATIKATFNFRQLSELCACSNDAGKTANSTVSAQTPQTRYRTHVASGSELTSENITFKLLVQYLTLTLAERETLIERPHSQAMLLPQSVYTLAVSAPVSMSAGQQFEINLNSAVHPSPFSLVWFTPNEAERDHTRGVKDILGARMAKGSSKVAPTGDLVCPIEELALWIANDQLVNHYTPDLSVLAQKRHLPAGSYLQDDYGVMLIPHAPFKCADSSQITGFSDYSAISNIKLQATLRAGCPAGTLHFMQAAIIMVNTLNKNAYVSWT